jgi:glyoxylase-like metal-dependent hydrolase (beta-lactamase superfamily II)
MQDSSDFELSPNRHAPQKEKIKVRIRISATILTVLVGLSTIPYVQSQSKPSPLKLDVFTSSANGFSVTSTMVYGDKEMLVIDPQFLLSEARRLAGRIRASGKTLTAIYTTHAHPDHFLGVAALKQEFPTARYVALPQVVERIKTAWPARRNFWYATYKEDLPSETPILPEPLAEPSLNLEGNRLVITGEVMGDGPGNSFVHIPSLNAVVAGDIIFNRSHFGPPADAAPLNATLDQIKALKPKILVAGHQAEGTPNDPAAIEFMRNYIADFNAFRMSSTSADELKKKMLAKYPKLALENLLDGAATRAFPAKQ